MKEILSRRSFVQSGALIAAACAAPGATPLLAETTTAPAKSLPVKLGLASYTFRNFTRAQMLGFMKQLNVTALNAKDVKDHLPADPTEEAKALADYASVGVKLHAAGAIYFAKDEDADIRAKFEYCKRVGIGVIVAGDPAPATLPRIEKFVKEYDIRIAIHNHGPEDKLWPSPLDVLKAIHRVGPRLFNIHMKDLTDFKSRESQVAVGEGIMPVRGIFQALIAIKYKGFVDLEYEIHGDDPMPGVTASFAYMRGVLAGMGYATHA